MNRKEQVKIHLAVEDAFNNILKGYEQRLQLAAVEFAENMSDENCRKRAAEKVHETKIAKQLLGRASACVTGILETALKEYEQAKRDAEQMERAKDSAAKGVADPNV